jgi:hypothetical protein
MRKSLLLPVVFVILYLVAAFVLLGRLGGAGHGWGIGAFLDLSLPASLIAIAIDELFPHHDLAVWLTVLFGSLQYGLLGFLLQAVTSYVIGRLT